MNQRSDPSSISFGRLLRQTADTVHQQQAEIADLKKGQLSEQEKAQAKQLATERKQERLRASQMIASYDTTPDDYLSLDQSLLTTAQREQIRHNRNAQMSAGVSALPVFDRDAMQRIQNMREAVRVSGGAFTQTAAPIFSAEPPTPFERWQANQNRPETQRHNQQMQLEQNQRVIQQARLQEMQQAPRPAGIDFLNPNTPN